MLIQATNLGLHTLRGQEGNSSTITGIEAKRERNTRDEKWQT